MVDVAQARPGRVIEIPNAAPVVAMQVFRDQLYVATSAGVYVLVGERLEPVPFSRAPQAQSDDGQKR